MQDHSQHDMETSPKDYVLFALIILGIFVVSYLIAHGWSARYFMSVFFLVFGIFKLLDLPGFVMSYIGYDIIASKWTGYAYAYPFIELLLSLGYFLNISWINLPTVIFMAIGSIGVAQQLLRGSKVRCACLGTYVKLPLTTVSLIEDLAMGIMALALLTNLHFG